MSDSPRIEALRRRVDRDPASIAFAQLAEAYRRDGQYADAVRVCRAGLERHPGYISARVTLGRALLELGELDAARAELEQVLRVAPENLAAIRSLAEIHQRGGEPSAPEPETVPAPPVVEPEEVRQEPRAPTSPWPPTRRAEPPDAGIDAAPDVLDLAPLTAGAAGAAARRQLPVFERWLEAILADREQRGGGA